MMSQRDQVLLFLDSQPDGRFSDDRKRPNCVELIANETGLERKSVTGALLGLQEKGLVERDTGTPGTKTTAAAWVTPAGAERAKELRANPPTRKPRRKKIHKRKQEARQQTGREPLKLHDQPRVVGALIREDGGYEYILSHNDRKVLVTEVSSE